MQVGPYTVRAELARGGTGVVYRAQDGEGRRVALKLLHAQRSADPRVRQRFQREVQALTRLRHPHVVPILGAGEHEGVPWLALELVEGESLHERLRGGSLPIADAVRIGRQLAQALSHVHAEGFVHRDLKPDNVLLRGDDALLTDFGLVLEGAGEGTRLTQTGVFHGTPGFWSPEQARGQLEALGPRTDVYGLGAVLYACLTGHAPVEAESLFAFLASLSFRSTEAPSRTRPEVPEWLDRVCMRCLSVDPEARPASAREVARLLARGGGKRLPGWTWPAVGLVGAAALVAVALQILVPGPPLARPAPRAAAAVAAVDSGPYQLELERAFQELRVASLRHYAERRYTLAMAEVSAVLELAPDFAEAYVLRAQIFFSLGHPEPALDDLLRALDFDPDLAEAYTVRGSCLLHQRRFGEALAALERARELGSLAPTVDLSCGAARFQLGRFDEALADFERGLRQHPTSQPLASARGVVLQRLGRHAEAVEAVNVAEALGPVELSVRRARAASLVSLGRDGEALADLRHLIEARPADASLHGLLAAALFALERTPEALEAVGRALALAPEDPELHVKDAWYRYRSGRPVREVLERFARALELDPELAVAYRLRGQLRLEAGQALEAEHDLERAVACGADPLQVYVGLAEALTDLGRIEDSVRAFSRAIEAAPRRADLYAARGLRLSMLGLYAEALADYDRALALGSEDLHTHNARAGALVGLGRTEEAAQVFQRLTELAPRSVLPHFNLGFLYTTQLGRSDDARACFARVLELEPGHGQARYMLAVCDAQEDRFEAALSTLDALLADLPSHAEAHLYRGLCLLLLRRPEEALGAIERGLRFAPGNGRGHFLRGKCQLALGRPLEAHRDLTRALQSGLSPAELRALEIPPTRD
ncbi:MAG: tetratricopeptide repeat protein [Planctomycetota bacterium]